MSNDKKIYVNYNFNRNTIKDVIIENNYIDNYVDTWITNHFYYINNYVFNTNNSIIYKCISAHTSSYSFNIDINNWTVSSNLDQRKYPTSNEKGLFYFDTDLNRLKVWDGTRFRIVKYLDDVENHSNEDVQLDNIWVDSYSIPNNTASASTSTILYKHTNATSSYLTNSYSFAFGEISAATNSYATYSNNQYRLALNNIVPEHYGATSVYKPILKTYNGITISESFKSWKLEDNKVTFYDGFSKTGSIIIDETHPPTITYYEYIGRRLSVNSIRGNPRYQISATYGYATGSSFIMPIIGNVNSLSQINEILINGLLIYNTYIVSNYNEITIDMDAIGYEIDNRDLIYIEII